MRSFLKKHKARLMLQDIPSLENFNQLNFDEKAWHVWHRATFLIVRQSKNYRINLYHMNGYYIQLFYHVTRNKIERIAATPSHKVVNNYLPMIELDLDGIVN
jgi:hypothetical protein